MEQNEKRIYKYVLFEVSRARMRLYLNAFLRIETNLQYIHSIHFTLTRNTQHQYKKNNFCLFFFLFMVYPSFLERKKSLIFFTKKKEGNFRSKIDRDSREEEMYVK